jgi:hypothetical protein
MLAQGRKEGQILTTDVCADSAEGRPRSWAHSASLRVFIPEQHEPTRPFSPISERAILSYIAASSPRLLVSIKIPIHRPYTAFSPWPSRHHRLTAVPGDDSFSLLAG